MKIENIETPALYIDLDQLDENIEKGMTYTQAPSLSLRPHYKSSRCIEVALRQMAAGAKGMSCATVGEAEDLILAGVNDVLIANQVVGRSKIAKVAYLAGCCRLTVCVDNIDNIRDLQKAAAANNTIIHCLVEYNVGLNRCGVESPEDFLRLAKEVDSSENLIFEGVEAYAGQIAHEKNYEVRKRASLAVDKRLADLRDYVRGRGLEIKEFSGASTGTAEFKKEGGIYTELQVGGYVFMDVAYWDLNLPFKNSLFILARVVSVNGDRLVIDAGRKVMTCDRALPVLKDFPAAIIRPNEEHSTFELAGHTSKIGDLLVLFPGQCSTTMNLHDKVYLTRNGQVVGLASVSSRGKS